MLRGEAGRLKYENHIGEDGLPPISGITKRKKRERIRRTGRRWQSSKAKAQSAWLRRRACGSTISFSGIPKMADIIREQVTIYYNRGYNPSVSVFSGGHFVCEAEPVELMALIDPDEERGGSAHGRPSGSSVRSRTGWRISGNPRSGLPERHTPREIDEQRQRMATVTSLEAARAGKSQAAGRGQGGRAAQGCIRRRNAVRSMIAANGEKAAQTKRALSVTKREEAWKEEKGETDDGKREKRNARKFGRICANREFCRRRKSR